MEHDLVDLRAAEFIQDKHGTIARLRAKGWHAPVQGGHVFFNVQEALWVLRCEDFCFNFFQIDPKTSPYLAASIENELLNLHGGPHERLKKIVMKALRNQVVDGLQARVTDIANDLIDAMPDEGEVDFCEVFADPFPARILGPMLGVPYSDIGGFDKWIRIGGRKIDALQSGDGIDAVEDANRKMHDYLRDLLNERRTNPGDDIFSELITAEIDGVRLGQEELVSLAAEMASAGVDTTRAQLPLILLDLLSHPDQMAKLRADPSLAKMAVDEGMRYSPLPWALPHRALRDVEYNGLQIKKGDLAMVLIPAVNRDPAVIPDPDIFDISRPRMRNFGFGYGMHSCPGAHLARLEMTTALQCLLRRLDVDQPHLSGPV